MCQGTGTSRMAVFGDSYRVEYNAAGVLVTEDNVSNSRLFPCARMQTVINLASPTNLRQVVHSCRM